MSMNSYMQFIQGIIDGKVPPPPIAQLLGFRITDYCEGCTTIEIDVDERLYNPMGTLHGGVYCDIADAAMGISFFTTLGPNETFTTIDLGMTFLRPVKRGKLVASSKILKRGKLLGYLECEITDAEGNMVAKASSTCMVLKSGKKTNFEEIAEKLSGSEE